MKRLFCIEDRHSGKHVCDASGDILYFTKKTEAKKTRNEQNKESNTDRFRIRRGPDHRLGESKDVDTF